MDARHGLIWIFSLLLAACSAGPAASFKGVGQGTELSAVQVRRGADRGAVEWLLLADLAGEEALLRTLSERYHLERLRSDADLEQILAKEFPGMQGKDRALALWQRYRSATFSPLEADNRTIVFFDSAGKAVEAWPSVAELRSSNARP